MSTVHSMTQTSDDVIFCCFIWYNFIYCHILASGVDWCRPVSSYTDDASLLYIKMIRIERLILSCLRASELTPDYADLVWADVTGFFERSFGFIQSRDMSRVLFPGTHIRKQLNKDFNDRLVVFDL